jgi:deoxyribodipyrimidine photo-lyase
MLPTEEYAARTIRPKLFKVLDLALEPVRDEPPSRALPDAVWRSLDVDRLELAGADLAAEIARCEIDHAVPRAALPSGGTAARAALAAFVKDGLHGYDERRRHPSDFSATSHLSPWLHFGHIPAARVARTVLRAVSREAAQPFLDQLVTWRELAFNFCLRNPRPMTLDALPAWVHATMRAHARDRREHTYTLEQLEHAGTYDDLWNAGQRELVQSGVMHNVVRMLWGKSVLTWAPTYADALAWLLHLNDKYALDGRDPNSVAGIQWCFGKFDRPFAERPVWGVIRPMSLERARSKYELDAYLARWGAASQPSLFG